MDIFVYKMYLFTVKQANSFLLKIAALIRHRANVHELLNEIFGKIPSLRKCELRLKRQNITTKILTKNIK